jgi:hypothetical protein
MGDRVSHQGFAQPYHITLDSTDVDEAKQVSKDPILKDLKEKISGKYKKDYDAAVD